MPAKQKFCLVVTTVSSLKEARRISKIIIGKKLAACVSVSAPVESRFFWKEKIQKQKEWMLFIKTTKKAYLSLEKTIQKNHSYDVPEIISLAVEKGLPAYLNWIAAEIKI